MELLRQNLRVSEDSCEYFLFLKDNESSIESRKSRFSVILEEITTLATNLTQGYIWQRGGFKLKLIDYDGDIYLEGRTDFGDCIDDEWFIVYILREISIKYKDVFVRIVDNDGEFLLIEAANAIPRWMNPDNSENRVWIIDGKIHIIPLDKNFMSSFKLGDALEVLRNSPETLYVNDFVNREAFGRVEKYPAAASRNQHRAKVIISRKTATILYDNPGLISSAVEALFYREASSESILAKMENFGPTEDDQVEYIVTFTKLTYAQISGQEFRIPAKFSAKNLSESDREKVVLGAKVSCAMELLASSHQSEDNNDQGQTKAIESTRKYKEFIQRLSKNGFFKGEIPQSDAYLKYEKQAKDLYMATEALTYDPSQSASLLNEKIKLNRMISNEELEASDKTVDSDEWLYIDFDEIENVMNQNGQTNEEVDEGEDDELKKEMSDMQSRLKNMANKIHSFMDDDSAGIEGIGDEGGDDNDDDEEEEESDFENNKDNERSEEKSEEYSWKTGEEGDPMIDEDDFLEFFLKEALKLSPEEIEGYRSNPTQADPEPVEDLYDSASKDSKANFKDDDTDEEEWDMVEDELRKAGILPKEKQNDQEDQEVMQGFLQSLQTSGGMRGPAATLFSQMGISIPNEHDIEAGLSGDNKPKSLNTELTKRTTESSRITEITEVIDDDPENDGNEAELYEMGYEDGKLAQLLEKMNALNR